MERSTPAMQTPKNKRARVYDQRVQLLAWFRNFDPKAESCPWRSHTGSKASMYQGCIYGILNALRGAKRVDRCLLTEGKKHGLVVLMFSCFRPSYDGHAPRYERIHKDCMDGQSPNPAWRRDPVCAVPGHDGTCCSMICNGCGLSSHATCRLNLQ